jgi:chemotaxis protein histidine kinase CheA
MKIVDKLFRQIHSLKGAAKHLELTHLADIAHRVEDILSLIKKEKRQVNVSDMKYYITNLNEEFANVEKLYKRFQSFSQFTSKTFHNKADKYESFLDSLKGMVTNLSKEMGKETKIVINNNIKNFPYFDYLKNPLIQIIRNAVDHAIEDPFERLSKLKKQYGIISIKSYENEDKYIIDIQDDGRGLDFEKIRLKAIQMNLLKDSFKINKLELLQLIFNPNFTSKDHVTSLSGRGYGLDVVKDAVNSLGGKINVNTLKDKGTKFSLIIPKKRKLKK